MVDLIGKGGETVMGRFHKERWQNEDEPNLV